MRRSPLPVVVLLGLLTFVGLMVVASRSGPDEPRPDREPKPDREPTEEPSKRLPPTGEARDPETGSVDREAQEPDEPLPRRTVDLQLPDHWLPMPAEVVVWAERGPLAVALERGENPATYGERQTVAVRNGSITIEVDDAVTSLTGLAATRRVRWDATYGGQWERTPRKLPILVRVRDASGRPLVGIPVAVELQGAGGRSSYGKSAPTGLPDGVAILSAPEQGRRRGNPLQDVYVTLGIPTKTPITAHVPPGHLPGAVLELRAPSLASLDVRLVDGSGRPYVGECSVRVTLDLQGSPRTGYAKTTYTRSTGGRALIPFVPEGAPLRISVHPRDPADLPVTVEHDGVRAATTEQFRIAVAGKSVAVTGRLVGESGAPLEGDVTVSVLGRESYRGDGQADATGAFRVLLRGRAQPGHAESSPERLLRIGATATLPGDVRLSATQDVLVQNWGNAASHDVGTLRLQRIRRNVFVAGQISGPDGMARAGAQVLVEARSDRGEWVSTRLSARSDQHGGFEVIGEPPDGPLRLVGYGDWDWDLTPTAVPVTPGAKGVQLVATRRGRIAGRVLLPAAAGFPPVTIEVWSGDDPASEVEPYSVAAHGQFSIARRPGTYGVRVRMRNTDTVVATAHDVEVAEGAIVTPPELQGVDLSDLVSTLAVTVTDPDGTPLPDAVVWSRPARRPGPGEPALHWTRAGPDARGRVVLVGDRESGIDVIADGRGRESVLLRAVRVDRTIVLPEGRTRTILVRMPKSVRSLSARDSYHVGAQWLGTTAAPLEGLESRTDPRASHGSVPIAPGGTARIRVGHAGRYGIRLGVQRAYTSGGFGLSVGPLTVYGLVTLEGTQVDGEIVVSPTAEELDDAVRRMDADPRSER